MDDAGRGQELRDSARSHLRNALQGLNLVEYEAGDKPMPFDVQEVRERITAAIAILEQVHHEASLHAFSFARHVEEVV